MKNLVALWSAQGGGLSVKVIRNLVIYRFFFKYSSVKHFIYSIATNKHLSLW